MALYIGIFFIIFVLLIYTFCADNGVSYIIKYIFNSEYRNNYCKLTDIQPCRIKNVFDLIYYELLTNKSNFFEYSLESGASLWVLFVPLPASIVSYKFYRDVNTIGKMEMYREDNYGKYIINRTLKNAFKTATAVYAAYLAFFMLCVIYKNGYFSPDIIRDFLLDWLGKSFYLEHRYLYYLLEGGIRFFIVPFIYTWFAQMASLEAKSVKMAIFFPCIYYYGLTILGFGFIGLFGRIGIYFSPTTILASGDYNNVNSAGLFAIHLIPIIIGIIILTKKKKHVEI